ncbi:MAG: hypothetical protein BWK78_05080 [Thiotrichaceae bacterium IS1]|nr:MAG: hypothetical protein BWK78_05080 [Thiotrichaceae bacterium IS1]
MNSRFSLTKHASSSSGGTFLRTQVPQITWRESLARWIMAGLQSRWTLKQEDTSNYKSLGDKKLATTLIVILALILSGCNDEDKNDGTDAPHLGKVYVEQTSPNSAKVTWQAATDDLTQPGEMMYEVHISATANFKPDQSTRYTTVIGNTMAEITGLETGKKYYVLVVAVDKNGLQSGEREYQLIAMAEEQRLLRQATPEELAALRVEANTYEGFSPIRSYLGTTDYKYKTEDAYVYIVGSTQQSVYVMQFGQATSGNKALLVYGTQLNPTGKMAHAIVADSGDKTLYRLYMDMSILRKVDASASTKSASRFNQTDSVWMKKLNSLGEVQNPTENSLSLLASTGGDLSGVVRLDEAMDGILNGNERGINGVVMALLKDTNGDATYGTTIATTITKTETITPSLGGMATTSDGIYHFTGLLPGHYRITSLVPTGYTSVTDSDGPPDNQINITIMSAGENITNKDFLFHGDGGGGGGGGGGDGGGGGGGGDGGDGGGGDGGDGGDGGSNNNDNQTTPQCFDFGPPPCGGPGPSPLPPPDGDCPPLPDFSCEDYIKECKLKCEDLNFWKFIQVHTCGFGNMLKCTLGGMLVKASDDIVSNCIFSDRCEHEQIACKEHCPVECPSNSNPNNCVPGGGSNGDPHLYTFDNLAYDFQAVGEFILVKSTLPDNSLEIQVRQKAWGERTDVAINQATTMNVEGDKVGFYLRQNPLTHINGVPQELVAGITPLPKGGRIDRQGSLYTVIWPDAHSMAEVTDNGSSYLTFKINIDKFHTGKLIGLLGNADSNPQNDLIKRNGTALGTKLDFAILYPGYADSWRISPQESLFDYAPGETTETFTDRKFPHLFSKADRLPANVRAAAEQICRASGVTDPIVLEDCILDVALTGEAGFAASATGFTGGQALEVTPPPPPVFGTTGFGQFQGLVYDGTSKQPLNVVPVRVTVNGTPLPSTTGHQTNAGGHYETDMVPVGVGYGLAIEAANYIAEQIFGLEVTDRKVREVETINLVPAQFAGKLGNITGKVRNALDNQPISNLMVNVRRYINNRIGGAVKTTQTDQSGNFKLEGLNSGNYTIELSGTGLITRYVTALSIAGQPTQVDVVMSPELGNALYRIVLTWNNATDLDAHLTGPNEQGGRFHIYFNVPGSSNAEEAPYAWLNRDDADGFGPETMSIFELQQGVYRFSVHDYKNGTSTASRILADSMAKVDVYSRNGLAASFNVPNQEGTLWTVFEIDKEGVIWPINAMGYEVKQGTLGTLDIKKPLSAGSFSIDTSPVQTDYMEIIFQSAKP